MACVETVLIVGGGIAGLTLAAALHRQGCEIDLIERNTAWRTTGAGIAVQANGLRALSALGMAAAIERAGTVLHHWQFCDPRGTVLCSVDLQEVWEGVGPCIGIERAKLKDTLLEGAAAVPVRLGTSIVSLTQSDLRVAVQIHGWRAPRVRPRRGRRRHRLERAGISAGRDATTKCWARRLAQRRADPPPWFTAPAVLPRRWLFLRPLSNGEWNLRLRPRQRSTDTR